MWQMVDLWDIEFPVAASLVERPLERLDQAHLVNDHTCFCGLSLWHRRPAVIPPALAPVPQKSRSLSNPQNQG